jgi:hypothetical protein
LLVVRSVTLLVGLEAWLLGFWVPPLMLREALLTLVVR